MFSPQIALFPVSVQARNVASATSLLWGTFPLPAGSRPEHRIAAMSSNKNLGLLQETCQTIQPILPRFMSSDGHCTGHGLSCPCRVSGNGWGKWGQETRSPSSCPSGPSNCDHGFSESKPPVQGKLRSRSQEAPLSTPAVSFQPRPFRSCVVRGC